MMLQFITMDLEWLGLQRSYPVPFWSFWPFASHLEDFDDNGDNHTLIFFFFVPDQCSALLDLFGRNQTEPILYLDFDMFFLYFSPLLLFL
jgi:hypothetical protein